MDDIKVNGKLFSGVSQVRLNTADGGTKTFRSGGVGTAELNIAYGNTPPGDTGKLWVKSEHPERVSITWAGLGAGSEIADAGAMLPVVTSRMSSVAVGEKIYLFGGRTIEKAYLDTIHVYNTATGLLTTLDVKLPCPRASAGCALVGKKIYLFGGTEKKTPDATAVTTTTILVFDTETELLTTLDAVLPVAHDSPCCGVMDKDIYIFMGLDTYIFNTENGTFRSGAKFPRELHYSTAVKYGKKFYIISGGSKHVYMEGREHIYVYDTETAYLSEAPVQLPAGGIGPVTAAIGNMAYMFGGEYREDLKYKKMDTIYAVDLEAMTVTTIEFRLPVAMAYATAAVVGMTVYIFGGDAQLWDLRDGDTGTGCRKSILEFSENTPLPSGAMKIRTCADKNMVKLVKTDSNIIESGVGGVYLGNADGIAEIVPAAIHDGTSWVEI
jgi:N-acetylneuraminic acid mutarotase